MKTSAQNTEDARIVAENSDKGYSPEAIDAIFSK